MSVRACFRGKVAAGAVSPRAAGQVYAMLDRFEQEYQTRLGDGAGARQAALDTIAQARAEAAERADNARSNLIAQQNVRRAVDGYDGRITVLRETPGDWGFGNKAPPTLGKETQTSIGFSARSMLARDPWEVATWGNVDHEKRMIRNEAHRLFAEGIEYLRPKLLGLKAEGERGIEVLRAAYGAETSPEARMVYQAWQRAANYLADQFIEAGGKLAKREDWRLPNPDWDVAKARAAGAERIRERVDGWVDRDAMLDWRTGERLSDARYIQLRDDAIAAILADGKTDVPSGAFRGAGALANARDAHRFFVWKSPQAWIEMAEEFGGHASVFDSMMGHIQSMSVDTGMLRMFGRNPEATRRFIVDLFDREPARLAVTAESADPKALAAAARTNRLIEARVATEKKLFNDLWDEVSGKSHIPVNTAMAKGLADVRALLSGAQLGSAWISSITDLATAGMIARFNGVSATGVVARATELMRTQGSEIMAAQLGLGADSIGHSVMVSDRALGESVRSGTVAKISTAAIRVSGLRRWTAALRGAFGFEMMATFTREAQAGASFRDLDPRLRGALERYGMGETDWAILRQAQAYEPRPNALLIRPNDIADLGVPAARAVADKYARMVNSEMDYAVIENDALSRSLLTGGAQPGTISGELRRSIGQYRSFPLTFLTMHAARSFARGWDGTRLAHAGLGFVAVTLFGALAMQAKQVAQGRDPLTLDPTTGNGLRAWGAAIMQGGGMGIFGDVMFIDQTRYGNTWAATLAGPTAGAIEKILGDFLIKNVQLAGKGEPTHFAGDALYAAAGFLPGSSLWYGRLAFQRGVLDQLALMIDDRAPERFRRIEREAEKNFGQRFWWAPGRSAPARGPDFGGPR